MTTEGDAVFRPSHYTQYKGMEPFTFFFVNDIGFAEASICKYVLRWKQKDGLQDLRKARRIIDMMIELEENRERYIPAVPCL